MKFGALYYRYLEMDKMSVSKKGVADMKWWLDNLDGSYNDICHPQ